MIKRISLLIAAALMGTMMLVSTAAPAFATSEADLPPGCSKDKGTISCESKDYPGNSEANASVEPGGTTTTDKKTQGNLDNDSPGPPKTGTECSGPPGRC
jgi:hypothetical protein